MFCFQRWVVGRGIISRLTHFPFYCCVQILSLSIFKILLSRLPHLVITGQNQLNSCNLFLEILLQFGMDMSYIQLKYSPSSCFRDLNFWYVPDNFNIYQLSNRKIHGIVFVNFE